MKKQTQAFINIATMLLATSIAGVAPAASKKPGPSGGNGWLGASAISPVCQPDPTRGSQLNDVAVNASGVAIAAWMAQTTPFVVGYGPLVALDATSLATIAYFGNGVEAVRQPFPGLSLTASIPARRSGPFRLTNVAYGTWRPANLPVSSNTPERSVATKTRRIPVTFPSPSALDT